MKGIVVVKWKKEQRVLVFMLPAIRESADGEQTTK